MKEGKAGHQRLIRFFCFTLGLGIYDLDKNARSPHIMPSPFPVKETA